MRYRNLGRTGLKVSELCLGTMQFGWTADQEKAFAIMDAFWEAGGNFLDTADVYSNWVPGNPGGVSESIIGRWMRSRGNRHQIVVATKVRGRMWEGPNGEGLSRAHIMKAVDDSLRRLDTDYIDLYQTHAFDPDTPVEETMRALDDLVHQGKVRYLGCSNYPAWRLCQALWVSDRWGLARYESLQPHYNLVHRAEFERELLPLCQDQGLGIIPYSPLGRGFLTGKYRRGKPLPDTPSASTVKERYFSEENFTILEGLEALAKKRGKTTLQMALGWLLTNPVVTSPIVGANSVEQLQESLGALGLRLSQEEMATLNELSAWENER